MAISDELTRIQTAKADIKSAIEAKGVTVPNTALIDTYDTYIAQISGGGGGGQSEEDLKNLIERDITSITIPSGTTTIGEGAFQGCSVLTSITIPSGTTTIGNSAFQGCSVLTSVTIPNSVTEIGQSAFRTCANLTSVTIPDSVTSIGMNAFFDCINITSVTIGNGVISIGSRAFYNCTDLTSVTVQATTPPTLQNVNAFNNTNNCPIYVPAESVAAYKTASGWSSIASRIQGYDVALISEGGNTPDNFALFGVKFNPDDVEDKALSLIGENGEYEIYKDSGNKILLSYTKGIIEIDYTPGDDVEIWFSDYGITELLEFNTTFEYIPFTLTAYYIEK